MEFGTEDVRNVFGFIHSPAYSLWSEAHIRDQIEEFKCSVSVRTYPQESKLHSERLTTFLLSA